MMPMEVKSIYKGAVWRRDSDKIIHRGLLRLGKGSSGQTLSRSILNHYIIQASFSHYPLILRRRSLKEKDNPGTRGCVCQDFLFFRPIGKEGHIVETIIFFVNINPKSWNSAFRHWILSTSHLTTSSKVRFLLLCLFTSFLINVFYVLECLLGLLTMASYGNFPLTILYPFLKFLM